MIERIGIGWHVGVPSGWGTYGVNLSFQLARRGITPVIPLREAHLTLTEEQIALLGPALDEHPTWNARIHGDNPHFDFPFLQALGNDFATSDYMAKVRGTPTIGLVFFETAAISKERLELAERYALVVSGSTWNTEVLQRHGFNRVATCLQGVDLDLFKPGPRTGRFRGRFAIFSGGKLEYRKGQDLVVAAFKKFHERHRDALLVTAWHNPWPQLAAGAAIAGHVKGKPGVDAAGKLDVARWLRENDLPPTAFFDIGPQTNAIMPQLLREVDMAVFPNRCEGGTNLVAMECMAAGVPVALSRNTGHLDLIKPDNCYSLDMQIPIGEVTGRPEFQDWGETSIDELVAKMEQAYTDRADAKARGAAGAALMQTWDWSTQTDKFLAAIAPVV